MNLRELFYRQFYWIIFTFILGLFVLINVWQMFKIEPSKLVWAEITLGKKTNIILPWFDNGKCYMFFPSYMNKENTKIVTDESYNIEIKQDYDFNKEYSVKINGKINAEFKSIIFLKSSNIPCLHIKTQSGSQQKIDKVKGYQENISLDLVLANRNILNEDLTGQIKSRGNSSWILEKKPYQITLATPTSFLNMQVAKNFILIANAFDPSNIRNKIIYDLAEMTSEKWSPKCEFVDLYINGNYRGLYLLTEKIEFAQNKIDCSNVKDWMFTLDTKGWVKSGEYFITTRGQICSIVQPRPVGDDRLNMIASQTEYMEKAIYSQNIDLNSVIDLDSWVHKYIIDEISEVTDAGYKSCYFYYSENEKKIFGGPIWDYDRCLHSDLANINPETFFAMKEQVSNENRYNWYNPLMHNQVFQERVKKLYTLKYKKELIYLLDKKIPKLLEQVSDSIKMNNLRWDYLFKKYKPINIDRLQSFKDIKEYLNKRIKFLDNAWINNKNYNMVLIENPSRTLYHCYSIEKNTLISDKSLVEKLSNWKLLDKETNKQFDCNTPINKDYILLQASDIVSENKKIGIKDYLAYLVVVVTSFILCIMLGFIIYTYKNSALNDGRENV